MEGVDVGVGRDSSFLRLEVPIGGNRATLTCMYSSRKPDAACTKQAYY